MADRGGEFRFLQGIHLKNDIRINIFISKRPLVTKFCKQVHLQNLTQVRLTKQLLVTSLS